MLRFKFFAIWALVVITVGEISAQNELKVLGGHRTWLQYTDAPNALYHHFANEAFLLLNAREKNVETFTTRDDWEARQQSIRKTLHEIVGPFPQKTPLNAKVIRTVEKDFYRVEHIVYESRPGFYVTSSLFIPKSLKRRQQAPVVIYCSGHSPQGYRGDVYQRVMLNLVKKGFVVFAFDPVGQGERLEYTEPDRPPRGSTAQHSYPGTQTLISGSSQANYMIWDGIRAVDYLLTRKEIDPSRIGITGRSGGGTQSSYIAAFDERIAAVAPECYLTSFRRLLQSIGPQDAEQNFPQGILNGIDHPDLLIVRAPKPALMITTTGDMFNIQGARETAAEISRAYEAVGGKENFSMVEDDGAHTSTKKNREAMYAFFQKHLNNPGSNTDEEMEILKDDEIQVTPTGQVATSFKGETVFSLNRKYVEATLLGRPDNRNILSVARTLSGYQEPENFGTVVFTGRARRDGYTIEKYLVPGEGDYVIPLLIMKPLAPSGKTVLYLNPAGKEVEGAVGGEIERLVKSGFTVAAPDLPGTGELGPGTFRGDAFIDGVSHNVWYGAMQVGKSITGLQAADIARVIAHVQTDHNTVYAIARKEMAAVLIHAAAFQNAIEKIALIEPLSSYRSLVTTRFYLSSFISGAIPGMLKAYDLPDLAATLAPRSLLIVDALNGAGEPASDEETKVDFSTIENAYSGSQKGDLKIIRTTGAQDAITQVINEWSVD